MGGPRWHYTKQNKSDRERQIPYDSSYMWNLKNKVNRKTKQNRNRLRYREQTDGCQMGEGWGDGQRK